MRLTGIWRLSLSTALAVAAMLGGFAIDIGLKAVAVVAVTRPLLKQMDLELYTYMARHRAGVGAPRWRVELLVYRPQMAVAPVCYCNP